MRAIDLYSGIGGWALGLKLAGIEVVESFEWWKPAAETELFNLGCKVNQIDIRSLNPQMLPPNIDVVVGSPPCTQFSYSNRGGAGDIADGLKDIAKFLEIVAALKPKYWVMENVPRVAGILKEELTEFGQLSEYHHLSEGLFIDVLDLSNFGLPQRRKRCIAGHFPSKLLKLYEAKCSTKSLGEAVNGLENRTIEDVNFGGVYSASEVTDHLKEPYLDFEETRINCESKTHHPVYNGMAFPDPWNKPVRTVTATCTRVSRESVVVEDVGSPGELRRLTVRERGIIQGFPLGYQFFGNSYSQKLKMIGNAIPPSFTFLIAQSLKGTPVNRLKTSDQLGYKHTGGADTPLYTLPDNEGRTYPQDRRFWFAIRNLHFKSGMRFDLSNYLDDGAIKWQVRFYFGPSKDIREIPLDKALLNLIDNSNCLAEYVIPLKGHLEKFIKATEAIEIRDVQRAWTDKSANAPHPFKILDLLGDTAEKMISGFPKEGTAAASSFVQEVAMTAYPHHPPVGLKKLEKFGLPVTCGFILGSTFNAISEQA